MPAHPFIHWQSVRWFLVAGPPAGLLAFLLLIPLADPTELLDLEGLASLPMTVIIGLPFAYLLGLLPALIAGLLFGAAVPRVGFLLHGKRLPSFLAGAFSGVLGCTIFLSFFGFDENSGYLPLFWASCFAGGSCALVVRYRVMRANQMLPRDAA